LSLRSAIATKEGKRVYVRRLFATIADRYDLITVLLSFGRDRRWKARLREMAAATPFGSALDLACGTGDIAFELSTLSRHVIGLDLTPRMVALAQEKRGVGSGEWGGGKELGVPRFVVGDMMALPFPSSSFDLVTAGYGIRNVPDMDVALAEVQRVLNPSGRFLSLDFNRPANGVVRFGFLSYLTVVGSALGFALHGDPDTYRYIPESIRHYPGAPGVASAMRRLGFADAGYERVFGGLMAINWGIKR
jgi:demethylmenaquinone methyltransferase/2-methoxy-6-polyprenyl-1,4-benzoquinol methylase